MNFEAYEAIQCLHFPACGGCRFQDISYNQQLQSKQSFVQALFPSTTVSPIIGCQTPWRYRNKMEFSFSQNKAGDRFLGLILKKSRGKVFNLQQCLIAPDGFAEILSSVYQWWEKSLLRAFHFRSGEGTLRTLTIRQSRASGKKMIILTVSGNPQFAMTQSQINQFVDAICDPSASIFLQIHQAIAGRPTQFFEIHLAGATHLDEELTIEGRRFLFKISPSSFFQPNTEQAEVLYETALRLPYLTPKACIYDLYCGTAILGILSAPRVKQVIGIELNPYAVFDGKVNCEINRLSNINLYQGDVAQTLAKNNFPKPDLVILDPPRAGLDRPALEILRALNPLQILYISCNPKTQAQNLFELPEYTPLQVQPIDQFPHTPHIENICYLKK